MRRLLVLGLVGLVSGPAVADEARRLRLEAAALVQAAERAESAGERRELLEEAHGNLLEIRERYSSKSAQIQLYFDGERTVLSPERLGEMVEAAALMSGTALADEARRLRLEAAALVQAAERAESAGERRELLEEAHGKLLEIHERYPSESARIQLYYGGERIVLSAERLGGIISSIEAADPWGGYAAQLLTWLEAHKEYPRHARLRGQEGTVSLYVVIDRDGRLLDWRIEHSSGHDLLDQEAIAMFERAQPLPRFPESLPGREVGIVVPISFALR